MHSFERLIRDHEAIGVLAGRLLEVVRAEPDPEQGRAALAALAGALADHLAMEDADIYPLLLASKDEGAASMAREAIATHDTMAPDFADYVAHWTQAAITADWQRFAAQTESLVLRLSDRIRIENELLYPLALRAAHIKLRS